MSVQFDSLAGLPLISAIGFGLLSGLASSAHCVGMCGGLTLSFSTNTLSNLIYQIGRLAGYLTISVVIPLLGFSLLSGSYTQELRVFSSVTIGLTLIVMGVSKLTNKKLGFSKYIIKFTTQVSKLYPVIGRVFGDNIYLRNFFVGGLSALLPCGVLWGVVALTLTTTSTIISISFLFSFWLATLPALIAPTLFIGRFNISKRSNTFISLGLVFIGLSTISYRIYQNYEAIGAPQCH